MNNIHKFCLVIVFRVLLTLFPQPSYIHPDEFFQSLEVLSSRIHGTNTGIIPWEFKVSSPIRSLFILELFYGIPVRVMKYFDFENLLLICRIFITVNSLVIDWSILNISEKLSISSSLTLLMYCSSHMSIVFQNRTFSNSIESIIFVLLVNSCLNERISKHSKLNICFDSFLIIFGIFSRPTFICFMLVPMLYKLSKFDQSKHLFRYIAYSSLFCMIFSVIFILMDTYLYQSKSYIITPLNFLIYNTNKGNLINHGYHPFYTHLLANLPQIFGLLTPFVYLAYYFLNSHHRILFYMIVFPVFVLSVFPHQEMRFLMPIFPIACIALSSIFLSLIKNNVGEKFIKIIIIVHATFSFISVIFWSYLHEGGTIQAMNYISNDINQNKGDFHAICSYKMLMVPKTMLQLKSSEFSKLELVNTMGVSEDRFWKKIESIKLLKESKRGFGKYFIHIMYPMSIRLKHENRFNDLGKILRIKFIPGHVNTDLGIPNSIEYFYLKYVKIQI